MQVAPQPTPDLLLRRDQTFTRRLQLEGDPGRMDDRAGVPGEFAEQPPIGWGQLLAWPRPYDEDADGLALEEQRDINSSRWFGSADGGGAAYPVRPAQVDGD